MKNLLFFSLITLSSAAFSSDCYISVANAFKAENPTHDIRGIKRGEVLQPGQKIDFPESVVTNNETKPLYLYYVDTFFHFRIGYFALVDHSTCKVKRLDITYID